MMIISAVRVTFTSSRPRLPSPSEMIQLKRKEISGCVIDRLNENLRGDALRTFLDLHFSFPLASGCGMRLLAFLLQLHSHQ